MLHAPHLAVGHAVGGPGGEADAVTGVLRQVGQVLQADALAVLAVAGRAGEVVRAAAHEEDALAHLVVLALLRLVLRQVDGHAPGLAGDPGRQRGDVVLLALAERRLGDLRGVEALDALHAGHQPRLQVLHPLRVGEIARQLDEGALDHAGALAQVAGLRATRSSGRASASTGPRPWPRRVRPGCRRPAWRGTPRCASLADLLGPAPAAAAASASPPASNVFFLMSSLS